MHRHSLFFPALKRTVCFSLPLLFLAILLPFNSLQATIPSPKNHLLQFTAAGHVLGFKSNGLYVVREDHMLNVSFIEANGNAPEAAGVLDVSGLAAPLTHVTYVDLWPDINLRYEATANGIVMSTWEVAAGAEVSRIRLRYNVPIEIATDGGLKINYGGGWMRETAPIAWQEINDRRCPVEVAFQLIEDSANESIIGFKVGGYDPAYPLLIDPVLSWNTFMGSSTADDAVYALAVDGGGNVFVAGTSSVSWGTPVNAHAGIQVDEYDAFIVKLDSDGARQWHTFFGSAGNDDSATALVLDGSGNIYVTGYSEADWGAPVNGYAGNIDGFVVKLNANGRLLWNTFMGSSAADDSNSIALDENGNVYIAGTSVASWGTPITPWAGDHDAFVAKLDSDGGLQWNTFIGSGSTDYGSAVTVDIQGNVYMAGTSALNWGTPIVEHSGVLGFDAFVGKLDSNGKLLWNTFMGSANNADYGLAITVDSNNNVYLGGNSSANWGGPINSYSGQLHYLDIFIAKLDSNGELLWNTFMGSDYPDTDPAITVDKNSNVYLAGTSNFGWGNPITPWAGEREAFAAKLDSDGGLLWNTFMGSGGTDYGKAIAIDGGGSVYVGGMSYDSWGSPVNTYAGVFDGFVAKLYFSKPGPFGLSIILTGAGTVTSVPVGINCPGNCTEKYDKNSSVTLTAIPSRGVRFGGWSGGGCSGTAACTVTMDSDFKVTATFVKEGGIPWLMLLLK